jgi:glycosyltransferase involved in cell wall biosynthesis
MSRIVIDARELRTSSGRYVERLIHYLQAIDHEHEYKILLKPADMDGWQPANTNFAKVACPHKEFTIDEQTGLKRQVKGLHADLVHFAFPQQPIRYKGKTITTVHDLTTTRFTNPEKDKLIFWFKQQVYKYVINVVARKSVRLLAISEFVKDDVVQFASIHPDKITVTYEAADQIQDKPDPLPALMEKQFLMYVGRPTPHKNLERLIDAFIKLKSKHPELYLVLAGQKDPNYSRIETEVRQRTVKGVVFTGHVTEGRLRWLYENCAAYIFPSLSEGFGLPGLEAMMHGAPVVSSKLTSLPEIYGDAAHYFDPLDEDSIAAAIQDVLVDQNLRQELVEKGRRQAAKYSWRRMAEQTLEVYNQALDEN